MHRSKTCGAGAVLFKRVRVHVLDAIVAGAEAPEQVSELRGERRVDAGELGGQFVALGPRLLVGRMAAIVLLDRLLLAQPRHRGLQPFMPESGVGCRCVDRRRIQSAGECLLRGIAGRTRNLSFLDQGGHGRPAQWRRP
jgi:hypothetical protein